MKITPLRLSDLVESISRLCYESSSERILRQIDNLSNRLLITERFTEKLLSPFYVTPFTDYSNRFVNLIAKSNSTIDAYLASFEVLQSHLNDPVISKLNELSESLTRWMSMHEVNMLPEVEDMVLSDQAVETLLSKKVEEHAPTDDPIAPLSDPEKQTPKPRITFVQAKIVWSILTAFILPIILQCLPDKDMEQISDSVAEISENFSSFVENQKDYHDQMIAIETERNQLMEKQNAINEDLSKKMELLLNEFDSSGDPSGIIDWSIVLSNILEAELSRYVTDQETAEVQESSETVRTDSEDSGSLNLKP